MPRSREKDPLATGQVGLLEEVGSKARGLRIGRNAFGLSQLLLCCEGGRTKEECTDKHRNVARKLVLEGGWVQKRLFDVGWSDESKCQACHKEEGTEEPGGAEDKGCVGTSTTKARVGNVEIDRE